MHLVRSSQALVDLGLVQSVREDCRDSCGEREHRVTSRICAGLQRSASRSVQFYKVIHESIEDNLITSFNDEIKELKFTNN